MVEMTKEEIHKRIYCMNTNELIDINLFIWDSKTRILRVHRNSVFINLLDSFDIIFYIGSNSIINVGSYCTIHALNDCQIRTGINCYINASNKCYIKAYDDCKITVGDYCMVYISSDCEITLGEHNIVYGSYRTVIKAMNNNNIIKLKDDYKLEEHGVDCVIVKRFVEKNKFKQRIIDLNRNNSIDFLSSL